MRMDDEVDVRHWQSVLVLKQFSERWMGKMATGAFRNSHRLRVEARSAGWFVKKERPCVIDVDAIVIQASGGTTYVADACSSGSFCGRNSKVRSSVARPSAC